MNIRSDTIKETANGLAWNIKSIINWGEIVTNKHIEKRGGKVWSINDQIAHVHSEVSEVFQAIRKGEEPYRAFEECIDTLLSTITLMTIIRLNIMQNAGLSKAVLNNYIDTLCLDITKKLYIRVGIPVSDEPSEEKEKADNYAAH